MPPAMRQAAGEQELLRQSGPPTAPSGPDSSSAASATACRWRTPTSLRTLDSAPGVLPVQLPQGGAQIQQRHRERLADETPEPVARSPASGPPRSASASSSSTPRPARSRRPSRPARWPAWCGPAASRRPSSPTTQSSGTNTSSRNTSLNSASPVISRSGRTSMPGAAHVDQEVGDALVLGRVRVGAGQADRPVRLAGPATSTPSARSARQPPSTFSAVVRSEARSEPASGSLNSWHQMISPRSVGPGEPLDLLGGAVLAGSSAPPTRR